MTEELPQDGLIDSCDAAGYNFGYRDPEAEF
jgi:hypothetical protein